MRVLADRRVKGDRNAALRRPLRAFKSFMQRRRVHVVFYYCRAALFETRMNRVKKHTLTTIGGAHIWAWTHVQAKMLWHLARAHEEKSAGETAASAAACWSIQIAKQQRRDLRPLSDMEIITNDNNIMSHASASSGILWILVCASVNEKTLRCHFSWSATKGLGQKISQKACDLRFLVGECQWSV